MLHFYEKHTLKSNTELCNFRKYYGRICFNLNFGAFETFCKWCVSKLYLNKKKNVGYSYNLIMRLFT